MILIPNPASLQALNSSALFFSSALRARRRAENKSCSWGVKRPVKRATLTKTGRDLLENLWDFTTQSERLTDWLDSFLVLLQDTWSCVGWCLKLTWVQLLRHNICFYRDFHNSKLMEGEIWTYVKWSWSNKVTITSKKNGTNKYRDKHRMHINM